MQNTANSFLGNCAFQTKTNYLFALLVSKLIEQSEHDCRNNLTVIVEKVGLITVKFGACYEVGILQYTIQ